MKAPLLLLIPLLLAGCDRMADQPKRGPYQAARPVVPPAGIVSREPEAPPPPVSLALLQRGRERFEIYCSPCHGRTGEGDGMIVRRGFPPPPPYFIDRLKDAPVRHFFDVITNGYGAMYSYAARVPPRDRWAIAAYIRSLQASRSAPLADVPEAARSQLR